MKEGAKTHALLILLPFKIHHMYKSNNIQQSVRCFTYLQNQTFAASCNHLYFSLLPRQNTQQTNTSIFTNGYIHTYNKYLTFTHISQSLPISNQKTKQRAHATFLQIHKAWPGPFDENVFLAS